MLIYRYFGGLDELLAHYLMQKDYWANTDTTILEQANVGEVSRICFVNKSNRCVTILC